MSTAAQATASRRCAVYARVSSDERLDQSFNSIDAQREAGAAFIASQRTEGWVPVVDDYEDPGFSGGNMERPGLKRLLQDIQAGLIDVVVVYKIDRLSRSLADFAKMVEIFDKHRVSFSSVTQQINSATSMGRLMLNVLLSFAQFEREVTGERIRDKIGAAKRKGMWMGGALPLGYRVENGKLLIVPEEAQTIRWIYETFAQSRSTTLLVKELMDKGIRGKTGKFMCKQGLHKLLTNRIYLGELRHKGEYFPGQHQAIIDHKHWEQAQAVMAVNSRQRASDVWAKRAKHEYLLRGMVFTQDGDIYLPMTTRKGNGKAYRYYVVGKNHNMGAGTVPMRNLPAGDLETAVMAQVLDVLRSGQMVNRYWTQIQSSNTELSEPQAMVLFFQNTASIWNSLGVQAKQDIVRTLIKRVTIAPDGIELAWRYETWGALMGVLPKGTVGRELLDMETA
jgi:DNA invertase Pin-like site-specific DNA recombinase